jgi:hypothetical protein
MRLRLLAGGIAIAAVPLVMPITAAHADCATLDVRYTTTGTWQYVTPWAPGYCVRQTPLSKAWDEDDGAKSGPVGVGVSTTVLTP